MSAKFHRGGEGMTIWPTVYNEVVKLALAAARLELKLHMHTQAYTRTHAHVLLNTVAVK